MLLQIGLFPSFQQLGNILLLSIHHGLPGGARSKEPACQCRRCKRQRFDPWVGNIPGGGHSNPLQYSGLENPHRGAWRATVHGVEKSQTQLKRLSMHAHTVDGHLGCFACLGCCQQCCNELWHCAFILVHSPNSLSRLIFWGNQTHISTNGKTCQILLWLKSSSATFQWLTKLPHCKQISFAAKSPAAMLFSVIVPLSSLGRARNAEGSLFGDSPLSSSPVEQGLSLASFYLSFQHHHSP